MRTFEEMLTVVLKKARDEGSKRAVLVASADEEGIKALYRLSQLKILSPIFVGNAKDTAEICNKIGFDKKDLTIINAPEPIEAVKIGVKLCRDGKAEVLIKGQVKTADFFRTILDKQEGLSVISLLSVNTIVELDILDRMVVITDAGMLIEPSLKEKAALIENAAQAAARLAPISRKPKAAVLCAVEVVNEAMRDTIDAAILAKMSDRGQIKGAIVDGPLAMDNIISKTAAEKKGIVSAVAGDADIILVPNITTGNSLVKTLTHIAHTKSGSYVAGAKVPIIASSRSNDADTKFNSILSAIFMT